MLPIIEQMPLLIILFGCMECRVNKYIYHIWGGGGLPNKMCVCVGWEIGGIYSLNKEFIKCIILFV